MTEALDDVGLAVGVVQHLHPPPLEPLQHRQEERHERVDVWTHPRHQLELGLLVPEEVGSHRPCGDHWNVPVDELPSHGSGGVVARRAEKDVHFLVDEKCYGLVHAVGDGAFRVAVVDAEVFEGHVPTFDFVHGDVDGGSHLVDGEEASVVKGE